MRVLTVLPAIWPDRTDACLRSFLHPEGSFGYAPLEGDRLLIVDNTRGEPRDQADERENRRRGYYEVRRPIMGDAHGVWVHRDPDGHNLGVAGSWNVGAREVMREGSEFDWLVILSASMEFGPALHTTFREEVARYPDAVIVESMGNSWHLIAIARDTLRAVGLFDENFYPAYEEAIDWGYRQKLLGLEVPWPRVWCNAMSVGAALHVKRELWDAPTCPWGPLGDYYRAKWGGPKGEETFTRPFGHAENSLDWWPPVDIPAIAARYELEVWW